jgi:hypothetical protein
VQLTPRGTLEHRVGTKDGVIWPQQKPENPETRTTHLNELQEIVSGHCDNGYNSGSYSMHGNQELTQNFDEKMY